MSSYFAVVLLIPCIKIILGAVISSYFSNALIGAWWAGMITLLMAICAFSGESEILTLWFGIIRIMYCIVTLAIIMVAIVLDIQVAYYFDKTIKSCAFRDGHERCYCSATKSDFDYIFNGVGEIECNNVATRNPSMLNTSAAFSVACFLVCSLLFISLLSGFLSVTSAGMLDFEPPSVLAESSNSAQSRLHDTDEERL